MAKLTDIFLTVALLSLLYSTPQAQGESTAYGAVEYVPMRRPSEALRRAVLPDAGGITLKNCQRCTCCSQGNPGICQTMQCCTESTCTPGAGCTPAKSLYCGCDSETCA